MCMALIEICSCGVCVCVVSLVFLAGGVHELYSVSPLFYICLCRFPLQTLYLSLIMSFMMSHSIQFPFPVQSEAENLQRPFLAAGEDGQAAALGVSSKVPK